MRTSTRYQYHATADLDEDVLDADLIVPTSEEEEAEQLRQALEMSLESAEEESGRQSGSCHRQFPPFLLSLLPYSLDCSAG